VAYKKDFEREPGPLPVQILSVPVNVALQAPVSTDLMGSAVVPFISNGASVVGVWAVTAFLNCHHRPDLKLKRVTSGIHCRRSRTVAC